MLEDTFLKAFVQSVVLLELSFLSDTLLKVTLIKRMKIS